MSQRHRLRLPRRRRTPGILHADVSRYSWCVSSLSQASGVLNLPTRLLSKQGRRRPPPPLHGLRRDRRSLGHEGPSGRLLTSRVRVQCHGAGPPWPVVRSRDTPAGEGGSLPRRIRPHPDPLRHDHPGGVRFKPIRGPGEDQGHNGRRLPAGLSERPEDGRAEVLEAESVARALKPGQVGEGRVQHRLDGGGRERQAVRQLQHTRDRPPQRGRRSNPCTIRLGSCACAASPRVCARSL